MKLLFSRCLMGIGNGLRRHSVAVQRAQWIVVLFYVVLLVTPALLPLPDNQARMLDNLTLLAQFVFWGIWWPFVLLSVVLFGRMWCGLVCPEGALSEWASQHGMGRGIPRWMRWAGWPSVGFLATTLYGQLISVYDYAQAALLILGGSTIAAMLVGFFYGRGKRVWCRYLCPVSGVFALLAKLAPMHYRVSEERWQANLPPHLPAPNCAPLLDIRRMRGASACHACGRCSGQRDAVRLIARSSNEEIVHLGEHGNLWEARLLLYGVIGLAMAAFQWTISPWFIALKQSMAEWLVAHDQLWPLQADAPWWVLTHYPQVNDAFTWLDGLSICLYLVLGALLLGGGIHLLLIAGSVLAGKPLAFARHLALCLVPTGAAGLFLGLSSTTVKLLRYEGLQLLWVNQARAVLIVAAGLWSLYLGWRVCTQLPWHSRQAPMLALLLSNTLLGYGWWLQFWGW
ncbi:4Fe-4S binding protein [Pseudomonas putida]|uniref:4Fe-4S binding protein n=2 Tax=Pseudomonas TaxID=286 RepID=A0A3M8TC83_PSEPU|nr:MULTISPECIES: 4Fe-4S binding protein [Pseudomonas]MBI6600368.1 4Fe-4S binding protein [Pseudomonas sp. S4_EA_1b]MBI6624281.1 4Fe-4S binding protein [Pseudomonas rhodesiae]RNF89114.1 4Fe-4S binding protein [Pseudomonas putida]